MKKTLRKYEQVDECNVIIGYAQNKKKLKTKMTFKLTWPVNLVSCDCSNSFSEYENGKRKKMFLFRGDNKYFFSQSN